MNRLILTGAAAYAGLGVVSFLRPAVVPAVVGGTARTVDGRSEIRAVYGGLPLAIAGTLLASPANGTQMGVLTAGMAAGRAASSLAERRPPTPLTAAFIAVEAVTAAALLVGARRAR